MLSKEKEKGEIGSELEFLRTGLKGGRGKVPVRTAGTSCTLCACSGELSSAQGSRAEAGPRAGTATCRGHLQRCTAVTQP